jgi:hypothetical protein
MSLYVLATLSITSGGTPSIVGPIGSTATTMVSATETKAQATYPIPIPVGTDISTGFGKVVIC